MSDTSKILATKFTDDRFPIEWKDDAEKGLMWFYDDLHCPNPISPLYFDVGGWWDCDGRWGSDCTYMYQRFGAPIGKAWIAKKIGGYVYSAIVPPEMDADKIGPMFDYYTKVMPIYADTFLDRWNKMYIPRLKEIQSAMLDCDFENKSLPEIMIHMEDMLDMKSEAFRIHWIINLAQFQASTDFTNAAKAAGADDVLIGKINVSPADRNWDSLKALWEMKEEVCANPALKELFLSTTDNAQIMAKVSQIPSSEKFLEMMEAYRNEYGFKAMYTHEFIYKTWYEDPTPAYEAVRTYVNNDYDYNAEYDACMKSQKEAIEQLYSMVSDPDELAKLKHYLELSVKMAPITPDHHFYIDQGVYSHMRVAFVQIGKAMVRAGILDDPEDIFMLKYDEIRCACTSDYPVKERVKARMDGFERFERLPFVKPVPLVVKNRVVAAVTHFQERYTTATLSNLGVIKTPPELTPWLRGFAAMSSTSNLFTCVCSWQEDLVVCLSSAYRSTGVPRRLFSGIAAEGIEVTLYANEVVTG